MMRQYRRTKETLDEDTILFFRMGDFYEMFFEDAYRAAPVLGVSITRRAGVPMCGVPYHALDGYLAKVVRAGLKAAVCEQAEDPKTAKGLVRREISRIVSAGSLTEDALLDAGTANYLATVYAGKKGAYGIAALELSTGALIVEAVNDEAALIEALRRVAPSETLISEEQQLELTPLLPREVTGALTLTDGWRFMADQATDVLTHHFGVHSLEGFCGQGTPPLWVQAAGALLHYVRQELRRDVSHVRALTVRQNGSFLTLDECTCRNLDLLPFPGGRPENETLLGVLDGTCTPMGKRMLRAWIRSPLCSVEPIRARQETVAEFIRERRMLSEVRAALNEMRDLERVMTRLSGGSGNGRDLWMLADSLVQVPLLRERLNHAQAPLLKTLQAALKDLPELRDELVQALKEDPPLTIREGGLIREGYNATLDDFRAAARDGHSWIATYQAEQQEATGIRTLRVRHNNVFGFYIEVSKGQLALVPASYERRQTVVNAERFITPELKEYEAKIFGAQEKANALEYELFQRLRNKAVDNLAAIQATASAIAQLDVLQGFADRALALSYNRPVVDESTTLEIEDGRHPIVELQPGAERFVPNDTHLNGDTRQLMLITGPNMAGKSTYIRQVAILAVMAHLGSFVPAEKMTIGVMDRIFTRVGAGDDLARGRSTFMVEMQETANILNNATPRSLIVLDEIGRGTSTFDGISIAWSVVEYLHNTPERRARTLFATHYHELTELSASLHGVRNYTVQVREQGESIVFLRRIVPGTADKSYGIHVARLAGLPAPVVARANAILASLEGKSLATEEVQKTGQEPVYEPPKAKQESPKHLCQEPPAAPPPAPRRRHLSPETDDLQLSLF